MHNHDHNYAHYHCSVLSYCSIIGSLSWKDSRDESWPLFCPATAPRFSPFLWGTAGRGCKVVSRGGKHRKLPLCGAGRPSLTSTTNDWHSKPKKSRGLSIACKFVAKPPIMGAWRQLRNMKAGSYVFATHRLRLRMTLKTFGVKKQFVLPIAIPSVGRGQKATIISMPEKITCWSHTLSYES